MLSCEFGRIGDDVMVNDSYIFSNINYMEYGNFGLVAVEFNLAFTFKFSYFQCLFAISMINAICHVHNLMRDLFNIVFQFL